MPTVTAFSAQNAETENEIQLHPVVLYPVFQLSYIGISITKVVKKTQEKVFSHVQHGGKICHSELESQKERTDNFQLTR